MGFALAKAFSEQGAYVHLISGPTNLIINDPNINCRYVQTAEQMYEACMQVFEECNAAVLSAAVADYRVAEISEKKLKKDAQNGDTFTLTLVKNKDILASLGKLKKPGQILGGFSLETHNETAFAKEKLIRKNCNFIVLNSLNDKGAGFAGDTNKIKILDITGTETEFPLKSKTEVAEDIVDFMIKNYFS